MLQDIFPHIYHNEFVKKEIEPADYLLIYQGDSVLAQAETDLLQLPRLEQIQSYLPEGWRATHLFTIDEEHYYLLELIELAAPEGWTYIPSGKYRDMRPQERAFACGAAESLHRWFVGNRFCGRCGAQMGKSEIERALVCPECGNTVYPKICPGVIVAVVDGDRILLTQYAGRRYTRHALIAGFTEIGESVEQTVYREVMEEVGLRVKNLHFYKSQPWVLSDTLLMGFYAQLDGEEKIRLQEDELATAQFFHRSEIPQDYSLISLTGEMIDNFRNGFDPFT